MHTDAGIPDILCCLCASLSLCGKYYPVLIPCISLIHRREPRRCTKSTGADRQATFHFQRCFQARRLAFHARSLRSQCRPLRLHPCKLHISKPELEKSAIRDQKIRNQKIRDQRSAIKRFPPLATFRPWAASLIIIVFCYHHETTRVFRLQGAESTGIGGLCQLAGSHIFV